MNQKPIRQGDVILIPIQQQFSPRNKLTHLVLAEGEVTGHKHQISQGSAELYQEGNTLYLRVLSDKALLTHEEHNQIELPQGDWMIRIQREYEPTGYREVID